MQLNQGDYVLNNAGALTSLSGMEEVLQRVLIKLTARRGGFPLLPELGSQLYLLLRQSPANRETLAKQYIQEALADEAELTVTGVTLTPLDGERLQISVDLRWQGEYLDYHAQLRDLSRKEATVATGVIRFLVDNPAATDLPIPAQTVCMTAGLVQFETLVDATLRAGETYADVPAQAVLPGSAGNAAAGTILTMSVPPVGVSACTNPAAFTGGLDQEDDESLRERVLTSYYRMSNGTNTAYYEQAALEFEGGSAVSVIGRSRGIGTVDIIVAGDDGVPSATLLSTLQDYFDEQREIAVDVQVLAPDTATVNITMRLLVSDSSDFDTVAAQVESVINEYFNGSLLGKGVPASKLAALAFGVEGVENSMLISPTADLEAEEDVLPVLGNVNIIRWVDIA